MRGIVNECSLLQPLASPVGSFRLAAPGSGLLGASAITATLMLHGVLAGIAAASSCLHLLLGLRGLVGFARVAATAKSLCSLPLCPPLIPSLSPFLPSLPLNFVLISPLPYLSARSLSLPCM